MLETHSAWAKLVSDTRLTEYDKRFTETSRRFERKAHEIIRASYCGYDDLPELKAEVDDMRRLFKLQVGGSDNKLDEPHSLNFILRENRTFFDEAVLKNNRARLEEIAEHFRETAATMRSNLGNLFEKSEILLEKIRTATANCDRKIKMTELQLETEDFLEHHHNSEFLENTGTNEPWDSPKKDRAWAILQLQKIQTIDDQLRFQKRQAYLAQFDLTSTHTFKNDSAGAILQVQKKQQIIEEIRIQKRQEYLDQFNLPQLTGSMLKRPKHSPEKDGKENIPRRTLFPLVAAGSLQLLNQPVMAGKMNETVAPGTGSVFIKQGDSVSVYAVSELKTQRHS
jgi:hypothetical protein